MRRFSLSFVVITVEIMNSHVKPGKKKKSFMSWWRQNVAGSQSQALTLEVLAFFAQLGTDRPGDVNGHNAVINGGSNGLVSTAYESSYQLSAVLWLESTVPSPPRPLT